MLGLRCILDSNRWFLLRSSFVLPDLLARWILSWSKVWPMKETFRFFISGVHRSIVFFSEISTTQKKSLSQFICKLLETTFKFLIYPTNRIIKISQLTSILCVDHSNTCSWPGFLYRFPSEYRNGGKKKHLALVSETQPSAVSATCHRECGLGNASYGIPLKSTLSSSIFYS